MKRLLFVVSIFNAICFSVSAQKLPATDIYLINLTKTDSGYSLGDAIMVNEPGQYNNQPSFSFDGQYMYYSSVHEMDKTDVYMYAIGTKQNFTYIETASVSEFSPQLTTDDNAMSVLRQDATGNQQVWKHYLDGRDPSCVTPQFKDVGYYCWIGSEGMIISREVNDTTRRLEWLNLKTKATKTLTTAPGISIGKVPGEKAAYYIDKSQKAPCLMRFNAETLTSDSVVGFPVGVDDFTVTIEGEVWLVNKGVLYSWSPAKPAQWKKVYSFGDGTLNTAYRLATSRDMKWLAVVARPGN